MKLKQLLLEALLDYGLEAAVMITASGEIFTGKSHAQAIQKLTDAHPNFNFDVDDLGSIDLDAPIEDGFWDIKHKKFINRQEAYEIVHGAADEFDELHSGDT